MHPLSMRFPKGFNSSQYVYHYTKIYTATNFILKDRTLRFNQFDKVNDPKESDPSDWAFAYNKKDNPNPSDLIRRISEYFRLNIKVVCFSRDDQGITSEHLYSVDPCARGYAKPRMWATYGDNHKGVCLVFDKDRLQQVFQNQMRSSDKLFYGSVKYGRLMPPKSGAPLFDLTALKANFDDTLGQKIKDHQDIYFFYKHLDWVTENEYRFVIVGEDQKEMDLLFEDALVGVVLGMNASEEDIRDVAILADELGVPVVQSFWGMMNSSQKLLNDAANNLLGYKP